MADSSKKRKQAADHSTNAKRPRFPQKPQHHIAAMATRNAYPNGEVNVKNLLKSHENEIKSLEHAMRSAKKGLSRRAFQDVPRDLRRRTASHNPHRVPKRLRARSRQEARDDNTPITRGTSGSGIGKGKAKFLRKDGRKKSKQKAQDRAKKREENAALEDTSEKNRTESAQKDDSNTKVAKPKAQQKTKPKFPALATPATPPSRFRRRQRDKTWLPTHIWHTKRARMTEPKNPLWRFAIPLAPVVKSYRLTHRAASQRGAVAWDTSYMSTISLEGTEASIMGLFKCLHFASDASADPWQDRGRAKKWRHGTRTWEGWICERLAKPLKKIALITVIWCVPDATGGKRKAFVRVHPGAFMQLWGELVRVSKMQKPGVIVQDLRFDIGSIEIMGPAAAELLISILSPIGSQEAASDAPQSVWPTIGPVTDAASLPAGALLAFDISDPRFRDPPSTTSLPQDQESLNALNELMAIWPIDTSQTSSSIFDTKARTTAARCLPSQKSIDRRKSACTLGEHPETRPTDPRIPTLVFTSRESKSWTILVPWRCVMPVWRGIMRYPVSTGGNPRFGGLQERRQVNFERSVPHFPYDHPGTDAGWSWEQRERIAREHEWTKRPKGKRIEWSTIDLGNGRKGEIGNPWSCEWERLLPTFSAEQQEEPAESEKPHSSYRQLSSEQAKEVVEGRPTIESPSEPTLFTIKISMIQRGAPTDCARIYRLPTNNADLRTKWLSLLPQPGSKGVAKKIPSRITNDNPEHIQRRDLARSILEPTNGDGGPPKAGEDDYPVAPDEADLIGFVTTGNYNLAEGSPTAIANIAVHRVVGADSEVKGIPNARRVCIVRQAGSTIGRLARWEVV